MYTTSNLKPELQLKALKYRQAFVDAANAALQKGRSQSDAEFVGMAAVARLESIDAKNAAVAIQKDVTNREPPSHLAAVLRARELKVKSTVTAKSENLSPNILSVPEVVEMYFDQEGFLVAKLSNGKLLKSKNRSPVTENVTQHITIANPVTESTGGGGTGSDFLSEFSDENELDRTILYSDGNVSRINYQSGNYKTFEYSESGLLFRLNYFKPVNKNYRKTFYYNAAGDLTSVDYEVINLGPVTPPEFTGFFVPQYSEPQQLVYTAFFTEQYSEPPST